MLYFLVQPLATEPKWSAYGEYSAPDTWQKLALLPGRKLAAINLYREENGVGMAEAKAAIERLVLQ